MFFLNKTPKNASLKQCAFHTAEINCILHQFDHVFTMPWMNIGPLSGDAFDSSSVACTNLQNCDVELGTSLSMSHPVNGKWGITRVAVVQTDSLNYILVLIQH